MFYGTVMSSAKNIYDVIFSFFLIQAERGFARSMMVGTNFNW